MLRIDEGFYTGLVNRRELIEKLKEHFNDEDTVMVEENAYWSAKEVIKVIKENT